ncbi:hypothetical protein D3C85_573280 [compost metagenome]
MALAAEFVGIHLHAIAFDGGQHRRHLDFQLIDAVQAFVGRHHRAQHAVQLQGEVGVFGGVMPRLVHRHLVETDLLGALAAQVLVRHAATAQIALGQVVEPHAAMRLQHIGLKHRVVGNARKLDAFVGEYMRVVLGVMQQLGARGVFQPRLQTRQHLGLGQLRCAVRPPMRHRNVASHARFHRQRQANQPGLHLIQRGSLGVQRHQGCALQLFKPGVEFGPVGNDPVVQLGGRLRHLRRNARIARGHALGVARQVAQPGTEAVAFIQFGQRGNVAFARRQVADVFYMAGQVAIVFHRQQLARQREIGDGFAQVVAGHALDTLRLFNQLVDRAEFRKPFDRRLGAHLGHAGDVVHGIADQHQVVHDAVGRHAELVDDAGLVQHFARHGVDQRDVAVDQLRQVLVARGNDGVYIVFGGVLGQGADHVVRFHALNGQHRPTQRAHGAVDGFDLRRQVFGHGRTVRLVLGIQVVPEGLAAGIENTCGILCLMIRYKLAQHIDHAVQRPRGFALRIAQIRHSVESAVQVA